MPRTPHVTGDSRDMEPGPLVSVVIPVHNGERYLGDAIDSVLAQRHRPIEIVVVDDGSADASAAVCARVTGIRYVYQSRAGAAAARNRGVEISTGALLAFLDADDLWLPDKLSCQIAALNAEPRPDMVFGHVRQFHSPELDGQTKARIAGDGTVLAGHVVGTLLVSRAAFDRVGPFATRWRIGESLDWFSRARDLGLAYVTVPDVVLLRRLHTGNMMRHERHSTGDYTRILKASLDRRRAIPPRG